MPRDSWPVDRANTQLAPDNFTDFFSGVAAQLQAVLDATSMPDLHHRLEAAGQLLRPDASVRPTKKRRRTLRAPPFRCPARA